MPCTISSFTEAQIVAGKGLEDATDGASNDATGGPHLVELVG